MLKKFFLVFALAIAVFAAIIVLRPDDFRYTRTASINASPEEIFPLMNDFHKWEAWSPWAKLDPNAKNSFAGPNEGVDANFKWDGDKNVGAGSMTIVESRPNEFIKIRLQFFRPFASVNTTEFTFEPKGDHTDVSWTMYGKNNFIGKAMGLVMNCEKMVSDMFDKGLASMKSIAESNKAGAE